jgi:hypothetical protein
MVTTVGDLRRSFGFDQGANAAVPDVYNLQPDVHGMRPQPVDTNLVIVTIGADFARIDACEAADAYHLHYVVQHASCHNLHDVISSLDGAPAVGCRK